MLSITPSILGPLLFLIYVNDVLNALSLIKSLMFADDTSIFLSEYCYKTLYNNANNELEKIKNWLIASRLFLNIKKTKQMILRTPNSKMSLS